ncbi:hypothetical protein [Actinoplanes utahensis]|uniref:hypothetical protein n=1 Tax=Actinoplanes utahensis TaxID=1869 RepID=UPI0012699650|nr:hypothetical protein [Actinoplanes utahensis]GIF28675.1 hypothetical protein Aut01nite_16610 [Actinoplanes utahensis]
MTHRNPLTVEPADVDDGPSTILLGITVALLGVLVLAFAGLAVLSPVSLISLAPEWFTQPGTARIIAAAALAAAIGALLYQAVRIAGRGNDDAATWLTLGALLMVPWFSVVV